MFLTLLLLLLWTVSTKNYYQLLAAKSEESTQLTTSKGLFTPTATTSQIQCRDKLDFYLLLYQICGLDTICRELFYIEDSLNETLLSVKYYRQNNRSSYRRGRDFQKFYHQLAPVQLFAFVNVNRLSATATTATPQRPLVATLWPREWHPTMAIALTANQSALCSSSYSLSGVESQNFVYASLYLMNMYKVFVASEMRCPNNQQLLLNSEGNFFCLCLPGFTCANDANFEQLILVLLIFLLILIFLWILAQLYSIYRGRPA